MKKMKKILLLVFVFSGLLSCNTETLEEKGLREKSLPKYTFVEIEGCEYFQFYSAHGYIQITHKGNCKNTIHCYNK